MNYYKLEPEQTQACSIKMASRTTGKLLSLDEAMERHDGLVHAFIQRQGSGGLSYEEALQAGRIGLWRAIRGYDPNRGFAFSTYAWVAICRSIRRAAGDKKHLHTLGLNVVSQSVHTLDLEAGMDQLFSYQALYDLVAQLPQRQRRIIEGRYGLAGTSVCRLTELGLELGLSRERVRQLQQEALAWLRHPAHSVHLRSLLDKNTTRDYRQALRQNAELRRKRSGRA
jgi:RNA polymerase sigma factor (sigma-70 family)